MTWLLFAVEIQQVSLNRSRVNISSKNYCCVGKIVSCLSLFRFQRFHGLRCIIIIATEGCGLTKVLEIFRALSSSNLKPHSTRRGIITKVFRDTNTPMRFSLVFRFHIHQEQSDRLESKPREKINIIIPFWNVCCCLF